MFATVKMNGHMNDHLNFQDLGNAFVTLLRVSTGENWHYMLHAISRQKDVEFDCILGPTYEDYKGAGNETVGCGSPNAARAYLLSYSFVVSMVFLNLFIAVIL